MSQEDDQEERHSDPETGLDSNHCRRDQEEDEEEAHRSQCQTRKKPSSDDLDLMGIVKQRTASSSSSVGHGAVPNAAAAAGIGQPSMVMSSDKAAAAAASEALAEEEAGYQLSAELLCMREPRVIDITSEEGTQKIKSEAREMTCSTHSFSNTISAREEEILGKETVAREHQEWTSPQRQTSQQPAVGIPAGTLSLRPGAYAVEGIRGATSPQEFNTTMARTEAFPGGPPSVLQQQQRQNHQDANLSVARPVEDAGAGLNLPQAEPWAGNNNNHVSGSRLRSVVFVVSLFWVIILIVIIAVLVAVLGGDSHNDDQNLATEKEPNQVMISAKDKLLTMLPSETQENIQDNRTPQHEAWQWILDDPFLEQYMSADRLLQRFALATFFFATQGEKWSSNQSWLNYSVHECHWQTSDHHNLVCLSIGELCC